jgi:hypothetical protein
MLLHDVRQHAASPRQRRQDVRIQVSHGRDVLDPTRRTAPKKAAGGARRDRTDDLMLAKHALSQLSYGPREQQRNGHERRDKWWAWDDSNVRPHPYQGCALTT